MRTFAVLPVLLALGCSSEEEGGELTPGDQTVEAAVCESSDCLAEGDHAFERGNSSRQVRTWLPENPAGAPVIFVWHHLGGSPEELLDWMPMEKAANKGFVVVAAESRQLPGTEWDVLSASGNVDMELFDDMLDALVEVQKVDESRVYATGFSAGGLFTTMLTLHRSDKLAATAPFSGGAPSSSYFTPSSDIPVMVSWGGPSDLYGVFDFDDASRNLVDSLVLDGHEVLSCDHGLGHWLPEDAKDRTVEFFTTHAESGAVASFAACASF